MGAGWSRGRVQDGVTLLLHLSLACVVWRASSFAPSGLSHAPARARPPPPMQRRRPALRAPCPAPRQQQRRRMFSSG